MNRSIVLSLSLILALGILIFSPRCPADSSDGQDIYVVAGKISVIDTFRSTITVKSLVIHPVISYTNVDILIKPDTKITRKDNISINSIFDLVIGNLVNVRYVYRDDVPEALQITVTK